MGRFRTVPLASLLAACALAPRPNRTQAEPAPPDSTPGPSVTAEDMERTPNQSIEAMLMSRFPGVVIMRTADGIAIRIRGASSVYGSTEPLYVIDGVPVTPGPGGTLTGINPHDIATIRVLKDPASTTMWGLRGANGVILITTKGPGQ